MSSAVIKQNDKFRKQTSLKAMYFNRYLLIRYMIALLFFSNLYWMFTLIMSKSILFILPATLLILWIAAIIEQTKMYSNHKNNARFSMIAFLINGTCNLLQIIMISVWDTNIFYPFVIDNYQNTLTVLIMLLIGLLILLLGCIRLNAIKKNKDKHYQRILNYEKIIK